MSVRGWFTRIGWVGAEPGLWMPKSRPKDAKTGSEKGDATDKLVQARSILAGIARLLFQCSDLRVIRVVSAQEFQIATRLLRLALLLVQRDQGGQQVAVPRVPFQ